MNQPPVTAGSTPTVLSTTETPGSSGPIVLASSELLHGQREVWIRHGNDTYRLIHTRNGKLILQK